jgi:uncharacterized membrane protein YcfT
MAIGWDDAERVGWVDYAKGFCIVFVVMMHSTLGVEAAAGHDGWMHYVVAFARPFRMPDFFMISGLFLARVIDRDWTTYLDRKAVHFAYFYALWVTIQFAFKAPGLMHEQGLAAVAGLYLESFVQPFGTLWFIYLLPIFFVVVRLARGMPPAAIWLAAAALETLRIDTGSMVIDEFAARFVYFYTGYIFARRIFALTAAAQARPVLALGGLLAWGVINQTLVAYGYADARLVSLALGLAGACAVVSVAALMAKSDLFAALRYCGRHSIVIYLAFFLPMAASRTLLLRTGVITDIGTVSVLVTASGVIGALVIFWLSRAAGWNFLFERPRRFWLKPAAPKLRLQPAE